MPIRFMPAPPEEDAEPPQAAIPADVVECGAYALFDYEMERAMMDPESLPYVWRRVDDEYRKRARVVLEPFMRGAG
jgi:hypothetical protein